MSLAFVGEYAKLETVLMALQKGGVGVLSEIHEGSTNAKRPFPQCRHVRFAVETVCVRHTENPWSLGQGNTVFQKIL